ncbi:MAG: hypothetical protein Q9P01_17790 [Anaerolineae bacterium]|nr:hypothetical protein [Anaerolineae bacterium]
MINRRFFVLILFFTLLMSVTLVAAQGRGGRGGNGTDRPTRTADDRSGQAQPVGTPSGSFGGTMGDMPFEFELPEDWQNITIPDNLPTSPDDIEAMLADMALPVDLDLESLALGGSSDTAYAGIVGFAQLYLGRSVEPLYADEITTTGSDDLAAALTQVLADLPAELQQIVTSADGIVYWAVLSMARLLCIQVMIVLSQLAQSPLITCKSISHQLLWAFIYCMLMVQSAIAAPLITSLCRRIQHWQHMDSRQQKAIVVSCSQHTIMHFLVAMYRQRAQWQVFCQWKTENRWFMLLWGLARVMSH